MILKKRDKTLIIILASTGLFYAFFICTPYIKAKDTTPSFNAIILQRDTLKEDFIDKKLADKIKPAIRKWLNFYNLDIYKFRKTNYDKETSPEKLAIEEDTTSMYYKPFHKKSDDIYLPVLYDYSPNKRFYLNVLETAGVFKDEDGKWYYMGGDDCMEVYLTDRKKGNKALILWLGSSAFAEATFWLDNDTFIIVGYDSYDIPRHFLSLRGKINQSFYINKTPNDSSYFRYDLRSRGIITD